MKKFLIISSLVFIFSLNTWAEYYNNEYDNMSASQSAVFATSMGRSLLVLRNNEAYSIYTNMSLQPFSYMMLALAISSVLKSDKDTFPLSWKNKFDICLQGLSEDEIIYEIASKGMQYRMDNVPLVIYATQTIMHKCNLVSDIDYSTYMKNISADSKKAMPLLNQVFN